MPSEISHIVHAQRFLALHPEYEPQEFLSGTIFPDIRVLGVVERSRTHPGRPRLEDVLAEKSSWWAGFAFHGYLDLQWNVWVRRYKVDPSYDVWKPFSNAVKLLSDVALYEQAGNPRDTAAGLWRTREEELTFGVRPEDAALWHGIIAGYLIAGPTLGALRKLLLAQYNPPAWVDEVLGYLRYIEATPVWAERVRGFKPAYE
ncbi:MAG: hypothetical protein JWN01_951 [Patescibacteria group bacterium]|nr:hypothetical protein [Patescibacteria group bacterium]